MKETTCGQSTQTTNGAFEKSCKKMGSRRLFKMIVNYAEGGIAISKGEIDIAAKILCKRLDAHQMAASF